MSIELNGNNGESDRVGPEHCICGPDSEQAAVTELRKAEDEASRAKTEINEGIERLEEAELDIKKTERMLEECHRKDEVHFSVDGEPFETREPIQTPNHIIAKYSERDPATNYLVKIKGHGKDVSYKDKGNTPITIENCDAFQVISLGPAPVSDGRINVGVDAFVVGLREAGLTAEIVPGKPDHVAFSYQVPTGKYAARQVYIGLIVPRDFPITAPGGVHVSIPIHPIRSGGQHPTGGIHDSPFRGYRSQPWQYWSRPFSEWSKTKKTVAAYLGHLWKLWDTQ